MQKGPKPYKLVRPEGAPRNFRVRVPLDEPEEPEAKELAAVSPPPWLDAEARAIFEARATEIRSAGYWHSRFADSLALYASLMAEYQRSPAQASAAKVTQLRLLMSELRLTPQSSRGVVAS